MKVERASFLGGAQHVQSLPPPSRPEVAFIGRSNVGKSSLINRLVGQKDLARTSATPGRTQQINLFDVLVKAPRQGSQSLLLVDLPGFGFAKLSKERREEISELTVNYLRTRETLAAVCLLNDARRLPEEDEIAVRNLAFETERFLLVVLTKTDKLSKNELKTQLSKIARAYGLEPSDLLLTGEGVDINPLWQRILQII